MFVFLLNLCYAIFANSINNFVLDVKSLWRPEYGAYMVEGTPGKPYGGLLAHFNIVEANMQYRRAEVTQILHPGEVIMSITNFPR